MDLVGRIIVSLICLGMAGGAFIRYRQKKSLWLLLGGITAILAAVAAWLAWLANAVFLAVLAALLLALGWWSAAKR